MKIRQILTGLLVLAATPCWAIYGGHAVSAGERPWMAALVNDEILTDPGLYSADGTLDNYNACIGEGNPHEYCAQFCGAVLIASDWALTAAHCVVRKSGGLTQDFRNGKEDRLRLLFDTPDLFDSPTLERTGRVILNDTGITAPSGFTILNQRAWDYDLALVRLDQPVAANVIEPVSVIEDDDMVNIRSGVLPADDLLISLGYGESDGGLFLPELQSVALDYDADCGDWGPDKQNRVTGRMFCANEESASTSEADDRLDYTPTDPNGESACLLDSGGPLVMENDRGIWLAGITSWGDAINCGSPSRPSVYTDMMVLVDWLQDNSAGEFFDLSVNVPGAAPRTGSTSDTLSFTVTLRNDTDGTDAYSINTPRLDLHYDTARLTVNTATACDPQAWGKRCDFSGEQLARDESVDIVLNVTPASGETAASLRLFGGPSSNLAAKWDYRRANNDLTLDLAFTDKPDPAVDAITVSNSSNLGEDQAVADVDVQVSNRSDHAGATAVSLNLQLPAGLALQTVPAGCSGASGTVSCSLGALAAGATTNQVFTVSGVPDRYSLSADVSAANGDLPDDSPTQRQLVLPGTPPASPASGQSGGTLPDSSGAAAGLVLAGLLLLYRRRKTRWR